MLIWQLSLKGQIIIWHYFHKAQIIIWHHSTKPKCYFGTILQSPNLFWKKQLLYAQNSNANLALLYKAQICFGNYFTKPKILFWQKQLLYAQITNDILAHTYKAQTLCFDTCLTYTKSLTHGKYNYSSLKKYFSYKIYKSP